MAKNIIIVAYGCSPHAWHEIKVKSWRIYDHKFVTARNQMRPGDMNKTCIDGRNLLVLICA